VYERIAVTPDIAQSQALQTQLLNDALDIITVTSIDILRALEATLDAEARALAQRCILLAGSKRIAQAARESGWQGEHIIADSPEDNTLVTALTRWYTRARN
jgi:uroporphyrinogen-III synthase